LKKCTLYFLIALSTFLFYKGNSQVAAPQITCVSVTSPTSAVINWLIPPDPSGLFTQYQIWSSFSQTGPYTMIGTVNVYTQSSFTQTPSNANFQSQYYYITTVSGASTSSPSDTIRSIFLNLNNSAGNGIVSLNWNAMHTPLPLSSSTTYTLSREAPVGVWSPIYTGSNLNYKDTIYICKIFYNYKVEISDANGCVSSSNIIGDTCYNMQPPPIIKVDSVSVTGSGQTVIGWPPSPALDVNGYVVYLFNGGSFTPLDTIYGYNNTSYTYTASTANSGSESYGIAAVDSCDRYSIPSSVYSSIFLNITYDLCSRSVSLNWTAYTDLPKGVLLYDVYCSINGTPHQIVGSSNSTSFTHSGLNPGDNYCYFIRVRNTDLSISASSNSRCLTASALPGPSFVYINSVSVNTINKHIELTYSIDNTNSFKGCNIYKSLDGINFTNLAFVSSTISPQTYIDKEVKSNEKNYYYKVQVADDCDNPGVISNISKNIVLNVINDNESIFKNNLTWDDYTTWSAGVESFNIYRSINGVFDPTPIINVPFLTSTYTDDVQDFVSEQGKFSYYVEAVEGSGNIYGFKDVAKSNPADAYVEVSVFVPNAFAPRGINNVWLPVAQYVEKTDYKVMVFNRWGDKIFETNSDIEGWTGDAATDEVYVYIIEYKNARGEYIQLKGHLNIIR